MKGRVIAMMFVVLLFIMFYVERSEAEGILLIQNPNITERKETEILSIKSQSVQIKINNQVASTSIEQVFKNNYDSDLEGTYIFPLPKGSSVVDFSMYMNGKKVKGEVLDKDKAREVYESIVREMKDPGLLEYIGENLFKARVYPVPRRGEVKIEIIYEQVLDYDEGIYNYIYPVNKRNHSEQFVVSAEIKSNTPIKNLYSPSHDIDTRIDKLSATCGYEGRGEASGKDFILYYSVSEKDIGLNMLCYKEENEKGYFMMFLSPGELDVKAIDKDIIFVIDTSGSMSGGKLEQAKEALIFSINSLGKGDRFNVLGFSTEIDKYKDSLVLANGENKNNAVSFVKAMGSKGGTNINEALVSALGMFSDHKKTCMIVFLTDGEPTVGATDMNEIVKNSIAANDSGVRMFVFGAGNDVNTHLLDNLSQEHRGATEYVVPGENIEVKVSSFYRKISQPILSDISLDFGKITVSDIYPKILPDIFKGTQLVILGRYEGNGSSAISLKGLVNGEKRTIVYENRFLDANSDNDFIPRIWATRKIGYLTSEIRLKGENKELVGEIVRLSKKHGIMTSYTSYLVLENETDYDKWGIKRSMAPRVMEQGKEKKYAMKAVSGAPSVNLAMDISEQVAELREVTSELDTVKYKGSKTFYFRDNVWVDSKYEKSMETTKIEYLSKGYFNILQNKPDLGKYFSIGENLIVLFRGTCYEVVK